MNLAEVFASLDAVKLRAFVAEGQEEHLHLDFKRVASSDLSNADDKKNLAKALSGFANSDGGLVVWGVDARKVANRSDCAQELKPIPEIRVFLSRLNDHTGTFVSPIVEGVRHRAIDLGESRGCAVSLIPASDAGPHMAKAHEDRYYKRSGDSFYRMEHYDIADMFGRRRRPLLSLHTRFVQAGSSGGGGTETYHAKLVFAITNSGRGTARSPILSVIPEEGYQIDRYGLDGNGREGLSRLARAADDGGVHYGAGRDTVIHPGTRLDVGAVAVNVRTYGDGSLDLPRPLSFRYEIAAEDATIERGIVSFSTDEVLAAIPTKR